MAASADTTDGIVNAMVAAAIALKVNFFISLLALIIKVVDVFF
jgi:hypothetical protein